MNQNLEINTLRGLACVLLVAYHVIGSNPEFGLRLSEGVMRDVNDALMYIRMPLFTFLSGFVYAYRPFVEGGFDFICKKSRRLLLPMLTVGTLFAVLQMVIPGANASLENWYLIHIIPVAHFWFVESLFLLFLFIVACEKFEFFASKKKYMMIFFLSSLIYVSPLSLSYFSFTGFIYLTPYFLFGMGMKRYDLLRKMPKRALRCLVLVVVAILFLVLLKIVPLQDKRSLFALIAGCLSCAALFSLGFKSKMLAWVGVFSYSIYLFHVFFTAGSRIVLQKIGFFGVEFIFVLALVAGLVGPILVEKILDRYKLTRIALLGKSKNKPKSKHKSKGSIETVTVKNL